MTTTRDELAALMGLSERATQGEWRADDSCIVDAERFTLAGCNTIAQPGLHNAAFIAACVNFIRKHGAELVARVEADAKDAARYRWLRNENFFEISVTKRLDADTEQVLWDEDLDAAIDLASQQAGE